MIDFNTVAKRIFQILKGSGYRLDIFDSEGKSVYDPLQGRKFFATPNRIMITLEEKGENSEIKLYLSKSSSENLYDIQPLINSLRSLSTDYILKFTVRKFGRELDPKAFAFLSNKPVQQESYFPKILARNLRIAIDQNNNLIETQYKKDKRIVEAFQSMYGIDPEKYKKNRGLKFENLSETMYGTSRSSYQKNGTYKVIIRHSNRLNPELIGQRGKNIKKIFIQTPEGERFKYPYLHLNGARAMAQHLNHQGNFRDQIGLDILELSESYIKLKELSIKLNKKTVQLTESDFNLVEIVNEYLKEIKYLTKKIISENGYKSLTKENTIHSVRKFESLLKEFENII